MLGALKKLKKTGRGGGTPGIPVRWLRYHGQFQASFTAAAGLCFVFVLLLHCVFSSAMLEASVDFAHNHPDGSIPRLEVPGFGKKST